MNEKKFKGLSLALRRAGVSQQSWDHSLVNSYEFSISKNGETATFHFYGNPLQYLEHTDPDPVDVLESVLSDALAYMNHRNIDEFANEFGYFKVGKASDDYRRCKEAYGKLSNLGLSDQEISDLQSATLES